MKAKRLFAATILLCATGAAFAAQGDAEEISSRFMNSQKTATQVSNMSNTESAAKFGKTRAEVHAELVEAVSKGKLSRGEGHE